MKRNQVCDVCPGCGEHIGTRSELQFPVRKCWRTRVADALGYDREFIINLGQKTRIHRHHFKKADLVNDKPIGKLFFNI